MFSNKKTLAKKSPDLKKRRRDVKTFDNFEPIINKQNSEFVTSCKAVNKNFISFEQYFEKISNLKNLKGEKYSLASKETQNSFSKSKLNFQNNNFDNRNISVNKFIIFIGISSNEQKKEN